ncbi:MAG: DUF3786 domain-containing protein [Nitrososphaerota archaeon]
MSSWSRLMQPSEEECKRIFQELVKLDGDQVAKRCGVIYLEPPRPGGRRGRYIVNLLTRTYSVELDEGEVVDLIAGKSAPLETAYIILRYLSSAGGVGRKEDWTQFTDFPRGKLYRSYFDRYVVRPLARTFGYDSEKYEAACRRLGGRREKLGGISYSFSFLPRVRILIQLWAGKREEYVEPKANLMFNYSARYFLSIEDMLLAGRIMVSAMASEARRS